MVNMITKDKFSIPVEKLRNDCDFERELGFCKDSLDVPPLDGIIGQDRAVRSMQFGMDMKLPGYNIFVVGPTGTGKSSYVEKVISHLAAKGKTPDDWCYIYNFSDPDKPIAVSLPAGQGRVFRDDMHELVEDLQIVIPKTFEGPDYDQAKNAIVQEDQEKMEALFDRIEEEALEAGFVMEEATIGQILFVPLHDGKQMTPEDYEKLPPEEQDVIDGKLIKLEKRMAETMRETRNLKKETEKQMKELEKQTVRLAAEASIVNLKEKHSDSPKILDYLDKVLDDISENYIVFKSIGMEQPPNPMQPFEVDEEPFTKYKINLFVNNENSKGAPAVIEPFTSYYDVFGKVEYKNQFMFTTTDFTMVKPGAIHQANGGYLVLQAKELLFSPFAWETLKKVLKHQEALIENIGEQYRYVPTLTLKPEPIPLDVKIILIGSPIFYQILTTDEDFSKLFKVKVDFDTVMDRNPDNVRKYVSFISSLCSETGILPFDRTGLGKVVEYGSRLAENQNKLSTQFSEITEIVHEAAAIAQMEGAELVTGDHVLKTLKERRYRANRIEERLQEMILQDKIMIDTEDAVVGQINGLSVIQLEEYAFGHPTRITARTYIGSGGVTNIEREIKMSGRIHSKGVLTLAGYLGGKFAQKKPLGLNAQITFEQMYDSIDGDSASSAELYALISSLADVPLKQTIAVTGSINQLGEIQPIGGATQKIEGFFDLCNAKGLTGAQGVAIPAQNVDDLMLREDVVSAVKEGRFHIYSVSTVEEGIELLSGLPAGAPDAEGRFSEGSVFRKVQEKLDMYNESLVSMASDRKPDREEG